MGIPHWGATAPKPIQNRDHVKKQTSRVVSFTRESESSASIYIPIKPPDNSMQTIPKTASVTPTNDSQKSSKSSIYMTFLVIATVPLLYILVIVLST